MTTTFTPDCRTRLWAHCALALIPLALCGAVQAQSQAMRTAQNLHHQVRIGDTLERLAQQYLGDAQLWPALQSHNQVANPYRLKPGSTLEIPLRLLPSASASVHYIYGPAAVQRQGQTLSAKAAMQLQEGDRLQVSPDAFVTVTLADGSQVHVAANSQLQLQQLRRRGRTGSAQSVLEVQQGTVEVQVPAPADPQRRLEVITPVAATSVRGTHFDVHLSGNGHTSAAVQRGLVAVQSLEHAEQATPTALLPAQMGIAIDASGHAGAPTALLAAADTTQVPPLHEDAQWLTLPLPAVAGAQAWRVTVARDAQGREVLRNAAVPAPEGTAAQARFAAVPDGNYFVHLRAVDAQGIAGLPAQVPVRVKAHPVPPLAHTMPNALLVEGEAQLDCTPVSGVARYRHQIAALPAADAPLAASAFEQPLLDSYSDGVCQLPITSLPAGNYAWRMASVRMDAAPDQGPFAKGQKFRIAPRPAVLAAEALQVQTHNGVSTIHWPSEPGQRFHLQVFADAQSTQPPALDTWVDQPQWTAQGVPPGQWHLRIQVQDPSGLLSAFSPPRSVSVLPLVSDGFGGTVGTGSDLGLELR